MRGCSMSTLYANITEKKKLTVVVDSPNQFEELKNSSKWLKVLCWDLYWDFALFEKNIGMVLGTYFGTLIIFQIVIKIARVLTGIIICPVFILIYHVQPSNFSSAFGNVNLNANCKILRTAFFLSTSCIYLPWQFICQTHILYNFLYICFWYEIIKVKVT